ncbi:MAG: 30S ribosomal protein S5 [Candidatus Gracilibacteria bacterium]|nr:30S ribosomal protein S5 [Candidatus Gracilibacteria bacterium]
MANPKENTTKRNEKKDVNGNVVVNEFKEELLSVDRVTRVTAGGRQLRFRAVMLVGNGKGKIGLGTGKSGEVVTAIAKAVNAAKKNMVEVPINDGSVPYNLTVKYKSAIVKLHQASKGTGIIAGGATRKVLDVAGYSDVLAKRFGSTNLINNARATLKALTSFKK